MKTNCDMCAGEFETRPSHYKKKKRHFCCQKCYSRFRKELLPKEEQHAYKGGGLPLTEKKKRIMARMAINHAIQRGHRERLTCEACGNSKAEAHHRDYARPFDVRWLCKKCHWDEHKLIYENKDLLT